MHLPSEDTLLDAREAQEASAMEGASDLTPMSKLCVDVRYGRCRHFPLNGGLRGCVMLVYMSDCMRTAKEFIEDIGPNGKTSGSVDGPEFAVAPT